MTRRPVIPSASQEAAREVRARNDAVREARSALRHEPPAVQPPRIRFRDELQALVLRARASGAPWWEIVHELDIEADSIRVEHADQSAAALKRIEKAIREVPDVTADWEKTDDGKQL